jgi:uncharacterized protein (DUF4213/DUF364 family)
MRTLSPTSAGSSNPLLQETADRVIRLLGPKIDELKVERAVFGLFFSGVKLSDNSGGLCVTPVKDIPQAVCCPSSAKAMPFSGQLRQRGIRAYLEDLSSPDILKKTLAVAVLNALSSSCWSAASQKDYEIIVGEDAFDGFTIPENGKTVVVGALVPVLRRLIKTGADFKVLEQDPATLKPAEMPFYAPPEKAAEHVPDADLLIITGATILNNTLSDLLRTAKRGAEILVTGPTAGMLPEAFFERGVTTLGGILVTKADELLDILSEGGSGYHFFGKSADRLLIRKKSV